MKRTEIARIFADMEHFDGQDVTVCGWTRTIRDMKNFGFIELNDGSCFKSIQVVFEEGSLENYKEIAKQNVGAALIVQGKVVLTPQAKQPLVPPRRNTPCRKSATGWSFYGRWPTCAPGPTSSPQPSGSGLWRPSPFTSSSRTGALSTCTPPSSPPRTAKAPARCSG